MSVRYIVLPVAGALHFKEAFALQKSSYVSNRCAGGRDGAAGLESAVPVRYIEHPFAGALHFKEAFGLHKALP